MKESFKKWKAKNPQKLYANRCVFIALRNGTLVKKSCFCGIKKVQAHHDDYSKPLKVRWLCKKHHVQADKKRDKSKDSFQSKNFKRIGRTTSGKLQAFKILKVDNQKQFERDIMIKLMLYCHEFLKLNNAQMGRIFRRRREDVFKIITKNKPKGA